MSLKFKGLGIFNKAYISLNVQVTPHILEATYSVILMVLEGTYSSLFLKYIRLSSVSYVSLISRFLKYPLTNVISFKGLPTTRATK